MAAGIQLQLQEYNCGRRNTAVAARSLGRDRCGRADWERSFPSPPTHLPSDITAFGSQLVHLALGDISPFFSLFQLMLGLAAS